MVKKWEHVERSSEEIRNPGITSDIYLQLSAISEAIKEAAKESKGILLDIGSGIAPYEPFFTPYVKKYIKLDGFQYKNARIDILGNAHSLPIKSSSIDTVFCAQVLEHLPYPQKAVDEIHRILKPNGICILSTHMANPLHGVPHDYFRFTRYALQNVLFRNFRSVKVRENGGALLSISQFICWGISEKLPKVISTPLVTIINLIIKPLDKRMFNDMFTTNYVVVAKK